MLKYFIYRFFSMIGSDTVQSRGLLKYKGFPVKGYPFAADFDRVYGTTHEALEEISRSIARHPVITGNPITGRPYLYGISFPWGYIEHGGPVRKVDFYGFEFDREWDRCNPEWNPYIFRSGIPQPDDTKGCETGLIILGNEGSLRRLIVADGGDLERYLNRWADLGLLGPIDEDIVGLEIKR